MFKKSLTALAVLSTMTGYAVAGQVTLYGVVDEGLNYSARLIWARRKHMFKKSLTALAVLSTMTGYAVAGQVTLYGVVDEGLNYTKEDVKVNGVRHVDEHTFGLDSGLNAASRIGLTGQEALGNGMTVR